MYWKEVSLLHFLYMLSTEDSYFLRIHMANV